MSYDAANVSYRPVIPGTRRWLLLQSFLVWAAGGQLFLLSDHTDRFFAWTIRPAITATFLGASYWATLFLMFLSAWERYWARSRIALPATWVFSTLTLVLTLLHLDRFHLHSFFGWVWLIVYISVPVFLPIIWFRQQHAVRLSDPPRANPIPAWFRTLIGVQAAILVLFGIPLFIAPLDVGKWWPWMLSALTGRAVAAWLIGWGVALAHAAWENDWGRVHSFTIAYVWLAILDLVGLLRYRSTLDWGAVRSWVYVIALVLILATGAVGLWQARAAERGEDRWNIREKIGNRLAMGRS